MFDKVAVIGDSDLILPLKALGIKAFTPNNVAEAGRILESLEKENITLCFLHESFFEPLKEKREALRKKFSPVVAGFSDYRMVTDYLGEMIRELAVKATGSDSLVKKKGKK